MPLYAGKYAIYGAPYPMYGAVTAINCTYKFWL